MVVRIGETAFDGPRNIIDGGDDWSVVLVACGLWAHIKYVLLPSLMSTPGVIAELEANVFQDEGFRTDLARASCKEPPSSAVGDLATWL
eukprot:9014602-Lingulodinium_polyedra.AAC.1